MSVKQTKIKILAAIVILTVLLMLFVQALLPVFAVSAPNLVSYQGRLLNTAGVPLTATSASIIFRFYTALSGGTCLWSNSSASCATTTALTVTLTDGLFSVNLGDTSASFAAIADTVFADNAAVYLDVNVNGESLSPRRQVVSAPYALNAENLDGFDSSQVGGTSAVVPVTDANGNLVLTGSPQSAAVTAGSVYVNPASATADFTLFGVAVGGSQRFRFDADGDLNFINSEFINNSTNGTFTFTGVGGASNNTLNLVLDTSGGPVIRPSGAATLTLGGSSTTQIPLTTDNNAASDVAITGGLTVTAASGFDSFTVTSSATTNAAATITANAITTGIAEVVSATGLTSGRALSVTSLNTATADQSIGIAPIIFLVTNAQTTAAQTSGSGFNALRLNFTNNPTVAGNTENMLLLQNQLTSNATDNAVATGILIDNADTNSTGSTVITDAIRITNSGAIAGGITNAINIASTTVTTDFSLQNSETLDNDTDAQFMFGRNDAGTVTITSKDDNSVAALTVTPGGAALLTLGSVTATQVAITTDNNAASDVAITGGLTVSTVAGFDSFTVSSAATSNNAVAVTANSLTTGIGMLMTTTNAATANQPIGFGANIFNVIYAQNTAAQSSTPGFGGLRVNFTNSSTVAGNTEYMLVLSNLVTTSLVDNAVSAGLLIDNADTAATGSTVITDGLRITNSGGITGGVTNGINIASVSITTDLSLQNSETLDNDTDAQFMFGRNDTGTVTITAKDDNALAPLTVVPGGAALLTLGGTSATQVAITTDNNATNDVAITGGVTITAPSSTDAFTLSTSTALSNAEIITANSLTTGSALTISANALTGGRGFYLSTTSGVLNTGDISAVEHTATYSTTRNISNNLLDLSRTLITTAGTLTVSGPLLSLGSSVTASGGTIADTAALLSITQATASASGPGIVITNAGTGRSINVDQNGNTGTVVSDSAGGAIHLTNTDNADYGLTIYTNQAVSTSALGFFFSDNVGFDNDVLAVRSDATDAGTNGGTAFHITQAELDQPASASIGTQAMIIDVQEVGSADNAVIIRSNTSGAADTEFIFQSNGTALADGLWTGGGADYAEFFATSDTSITGHEVVCRDTSSTKKVKRCEAGNDAIVGVISTDAAFVATGLSGADASIFSNPNYKLVGLVGQIDTFATAADGAIAIGDAVTISSGTSGVAGKATGVGEIIGYALEPLASGTGKIKVLVQPQWSAGTILSKDGSASLLNSSLALASLGSANATKSFSSNILSFHGSGWDGSKAKTVSMSLGVAVSDASSAYRLSVANTDGTEVAYVSQEGNFALAGRLYPSDRGVLQTNKYIYYDGSAGAAGDFMRTNASGWATGSYDFAEMFPSKEELTAGELVTFADTQTSVRRSSATYDSKIAGVVSTHPGFLAGENNPHEFPIALAGRVPTNVTSENGAIAIGDPLTSSTTPGFAMKATKNGPIIGYALEATDEARGSILVFVRAGWYGGAPTVATPGVENTASQIATTIPLTTFDVMTTRSAQSSEGHWAIDVDGTFHTDTVYTTTIKTADNTTANVYATSSPDVTVSLSGTSELKNGFATIVFDDVSPTFNDVISPTAQIRVLVTANGPTAPLYVANKEQNGFTVQELGGTTSGVTFDWLVIAYRAGYEPVVSALTLPVEVATPAPSRDEAPPVTEEQTPIADTTEIAPEPTSEIIIDPALQPTELQTVLETPSL